MSTAIKQRWADGAAVLVAALFIGYGIAAYWPQPALNISPVMNHPVKFSPQAGDRLDGIPPSTVRGGR